MASRFTEIVVDCHDTEAQAEFWAEVLDSQVADSSDGVIEVAPWAEEPAGLVEQIRRAPPIDCSQEAEVGRLIGLGARHADVGQGNHSWGVLADLEGNEPERPSNASLSSLVSRGLVLQP
jgi:Glyoxalase-like domain